MREGFEANYKPVQVPADNKRGFKIKYQYVGPWYVWNADEREVFVAKQKILTSCVISLMLYLVASVQNVPVNYDRFVSMTGLLSLAPFLFVAVGVGELMFSKERMTHQDFTAISGKLKIATVLHGALLMLCGGLAAWVIIRDGNDLSHLFVAACYALAGLQSMAVFMTFRQLKHRKMENDE